MKSGRQLRDSCEPKHERRQGRIGADRPEANGQVCISQKEAGAYVLVDGDGDLKQEDKCSAGG